MEISTQPMASSDTPRRSLERRKFTRFEIFQYGYVSRVKDENATEMETAANSTPVGLRTADPYSPMQMIMIDISVTGLGFRLRDELKVGEKVFLQLPCEGIEPITLFGHIRYRRQLSLASDVNAYGVEFESDTPSFKKEISDFIMSSRARFRKRGKQL